MSVILSLTQDQKIFSFGLSCTNYLLTRKYAKKIVYFSFWSSFSSSLELSSPFSCQACVHWDFNLGDYERFDNLDEIKTGDLFLGRHCEANQIHAAIYGSRFTHAGMFHRCRYTNRLFVFDVMVGVHYMTWKDCAKLYRGHAMIRRLRKPLEERQLVLFQEMIDDLLKRHNKNPEVHHLTSRNNDMFVPAFQYINMNKINLGESPFERNTPLKKDGPFSSRGTKAGLLCVQRHLFQQEDTQANFAVMCTDMLFILLQQLDIISKEKRAICIKPDFFVYPCNKELDAAYFKTEILRNYFIDMTRDPHGDNIIFANNSTIRLE